MTTQSREPRGGSASAGFSFEKLAEAMTGHPAGPSRTPYLNAENARLRAMRTVVGECEQHHIPIFAEPGHCTLCAWDATS